MVEQAVLLLCGTALTATVCAAFAAGKPESCLPSAGWLFLAVLPFVMLHESFPPEAASLQTQGLGIVGFGLAFADALALRRVRGFLPELPVPGNPAALLLLGLAGFVVVIPLTHLAVSDHIPLIDKMFGTGQSNFSLALSREKFSKILDVPGFLKILFQWTISVVGPVLVLILAFMGRLRWAAAAFAWVLLYSTLSLARLPAVICVVMCSLGLLFRLPPRCKAIVVGLALVVLSVWLVMAHVRAHALLAWHADQGQDPMTVAEIPVSPGDVERLGNPPATFSKLVDSMLYRSVLTPMEVSNRWYLYFSAGRHKATSPLENLVPFMRRPDWRHPANAVGMWAYTSRFPLRYLESIRAYGSADADAFGQIGRLGPLVACLVLVLARLAGAFLYTNDAVGKVLYACSVGQMMLFPFQASAQAIIVSQGLILLLVLQAAWKRAIC